MFGSKKKEVAAPEPSYLPEGLALTVMPEEYRHGKTPMPMEQKRTPEPEQPVAPSKPPEPVPAASPAQPVTPQRSRLRHPAVVWGGIAVVLIGGGVAVLLLLPSPKPTPAPSPVVVTPEPEPEPVVPAEPFPPTPLPSSVDSDNDHLTDAEELLFGTDPSVEDVDRDGYRDGQEIENLYSPISPTPVRLEGSPIVRRSATAFGRYSLLVPPSWTVVEGNDGSVFTAETGESVRIRVEQNPEGLMTMEWYRRQFPDTPVAWLTQTFFEYLDAVWSPDGRTVMLTHMVGNRARQEVFTVTYATGDRTDANFWTTFRMMVRSFVVHPTDAYD